MNANQFYMITLQDAIEQYKAGCITAIGLVNFYFQIELKQGWKKRYNPKDIYTQLGISKATFYRAIAKLQVEGYISFEVHGEITVTNTSLRSEIKVSDLSQESQTQDKSLKLATKISNVRQKSQTCDNQSPEPAPDKALDNPPYYSSNSYQILIKSLSDDEREKFLNFCHEEASKLPTVPTLPKRWIEANAAELKAKWDIFCGTSGDTNNPHNNKFGVWANHPRLNEMWQGVLQDGVTGYYVANISDNTIRDFCQFVMKSDTLIQELDGMEVENV